jgi:DNA transformation protein
VDSDDLRELFAGFGPVGVRRMFGGAGIFSDGLMFALVSDGVIYLKADAQNVAAFEREQQKPFAYAAKGGKRTVMSYWRMPDRLYDDPEELASWARAAFAAARRGKASPKAPVKRRSAQRAIKRPKKTRVS